jgi:hypothetical protein
VTYWLWLAARNKDPCRRLAIILLSFFTTLHNSAQYTQLKNHLFLVHPYNSKFRARKRQISDAIYPYRHPTRFVGHRCRRDQLDGGNAMGSSNAGASGGTWGTVVGTFGVQALRALEAIPLVVGI